MNRSSDILLQIQHIRLKQKKPKTQDFLESVRISESQNSQIGTTQWSRTRFFTQQNIGERNSVALIFAIGIHVIIAILFAVTFDISNPIVIKDDVLQLELLVITNRTPPHPHPHPPDPHPPHPPHFGFPAGYIHPQENRFLQEVETPFGLPQTEDDFTLSDSDDLSMSDHLDINTRKPDISRRINPVPFPKYILKLPSIQKIDGHVSSKIPYDVLRRTKTDDENDLLEPLDNVGTETIPLQTNLIVRPTYPKYAQMMKKEGTVRLQVTIGKDGIPKDILVLTHLGYGLEDAAVAAVKKSRYIPAKKNGTAVASLVEIQFEFKLQE